MQYSIADSKIKKCQLERNNKIFPLAKCCMFQLGQRKLHFSRFFESPLKVQIFGNLFSEENMCFYFGSVIAVMPLSL